MSKARSESARLCDELGVPLARKLRASFSLREQRDIAVEAIRAGEAIAAAAEHGRDKTANPFVSDALGEMWTHAAALIASAYEYLAEIDRAIAASVTETAHEPPARRPTVRPFAHHADWSR